MEAEQSSILQLRAVEGMCDIKIMRLIYMGIVIKNVVDYNYLM